MIIEFKIEFKTHKNQLFWLAGKILGHYSDVYICIVCDDTWNQSGLSKARQNWAQLGPNSNIQYGGARCLKIIW